MTRKRLLKHAGWIAALLLLLVGGLAAVANGPIVEPDADVLYQLDGEQVGDGYGWIAMNLGDITGDGVADLLTTAPFLCQCEWCSRGQGVCVRWCGRPFTQHNHRAAAWLCWATALPRRVT
jgi:hypothetical protein